jgi:hypothetical protein
MHFHLPKPLHGWREFAGEVGIIVIGVLIALGAEGLVERWHWQQQVDQSTRAFKDELLGFAQIAYERQAIQPCLQGRLQAIAARLNEGSGEWRAMPEHFNGARRFYSTVLPVVYRPPVRGIYSDAWRNALSQGTINHLEFNRAEGLSSAYESAQVYKDLQAAEGSAESKLGPLGYDRPLDERTRVEMLQTIAQLDNLNTLLDIEARDFFADMRVARLDVSAAETQQIRSDVVKMQRDYRGACVTAPPLDLGGR